MGNKKRARAAAAALAAETAKKAEVFLPDITYVSDKLETAQVTTFAQQVGYQISKHNIPNIWLDTQGEGITIAVLDTGVDPDHPDLTGSIVGTWNAIKNQDRVEDRDGHGTHCTGIITANNNNIGMVGVAPQAKILTVKVLGDDGSGSYAGIATGIRYAIQQKVDIISMSLGGPSGPEDFHAAVKEAYNANIPVICAAGNSGDLGVISYPARYTETIAIGALNDANLRAEFSETGVKLDFMAPGVDIFSTYAKGKYRVLSGTSMATPWVAGVVALMMSKHRKVGGGTPLTSVEDVREHLKKTAIDLDVAGKDPKTGYGLIDVSKALEDIAPEPTPKPNPSSSSSSRAAPTPDPEPTDLSVRVDKLEQIVSGLVTDVEMLKGQISSVESKLNQTKKIL